jgi:hypothetical protein
MVGRLVYTSLLTLLTLSANWSGFKSQYNNENETVRKEDDHMQSTRGSVTLLKTAWTSDEHAR